MVQYGVEGSSTFLECQARSPHAAIKWHLQRDNSDRRKEVSNITQTSILPKTLLRSTGILSAQFNFILRHIKGYHELS